MILVSFLLVFLITTVLVEVLSLYVSVVNSGIGAGLESMTVNQVRPEGPPNPRVCYTFNVCSTMEHSSFILLVGRIYLCIKLLTIIR